MWRVLILYCTSIHLYEARTFPNVNCNCTIPQHPKNGKVIVTGPEVPDNGPKLKPGDNVPFYTVEFRCDTGFAQFDIDFQRCDKDGRITGATEFECLPLCKTNKDRQNILISCGMSNRCVKYENEKDCSVFSPFNIETNSKSEATIENYEECGMNSRVYRSVNEYSNPPFHSEYLGYSGVSSLPHDHRYSESPGYSSNPSVHNEYQGYSEYQSNTRPGYSSNTYIPNEYPGYSSNPSAPAEYPRDPFIPNRPGYSNNPFVPAEYPRDQSNTDRPGYSSPSEVSKPSEPGKQGTSGTSFVSGGKSADRDEVPWHAGVYTKTTKPYMQICGGSVVSRTVVISAAHCFWSSQEKQLPATQFAVAAGKLYRPWDEPQDTNAQKSDVSEIKIPPYFRGHVTNLQDDIALLILVSPFVFSSSVRPVCLDFNVENDRNDLSELIRGRVAGWGLTSPDGPASSVLKIADLPVVGLDKCFEQSDPSFRAHITSDKICAGYRNGTAVCKGDSGGGLAFLSARGGGRARFSLRGLVSGSPQSEHLCNTLAWASFTHLLTHQRFITETMLAATAAAV